MYRSHILVELAYRCGWLYGTGPPENENERSGRNPGCRVVSEFIVLRI